ncbi:MAG: hypothetical protein AB9Q22_02615 [Candidatus Reddybacter sp.]
MAKRYHDTERLIKEHAITKPTDTGLPFLIGSEEQDALSGRYRFRAIGYSLAFLRVGCATTWYISARLS